MCSLSSVGFWLCLYIRSAVFTNFIGRGRMLWCCHLEKKHACLCIITILTSENINIVMMHNAQIVITIPPGPRSYSSFQTVKRSFGDKAVPYSVFKPVILLGIKWSQREANHCHPPTTRCCRMNGAVLWRHMCLHDVHRVKLAFVSTWMHATR